MMAGLLDYLMGNSGAASPWSSLYPSALLQPDPQALAAQNAAAYGGMGVDPTAAPQVSPFGDPSKLSVADPSKPAAPASGFGAGAVPFGFAGPGSMNGIAPGMFAAPTGPQPPAVAQAAASAPTDASSVNRSQAPDDFVPVGDYQMPAFRGRGAAPDAPAPAAAPAPAPAPAAAPSAAPAPFSLAGSGSGAGDRLMKATRGFVGNMQTGPIGALVGGLGALITGQETDPSSISRQQSNASAQALIAKGASPAEAAAAIHNPALMTAMIQQYYGKDKWHTVQVGEDGDGRKTYMQENQVDGTLRDIPRNGAASAPSGAADTVTGPDGKPIQIPPGVNRKEFIKQVTHANADAATGKQTEAQAKSASYAARMQKAEADLSTLQNEGLSAVQAASSSVPVVGNYLQTSKHQQYETAKSAFISAKLRAESGAAISPSEYTREEKELFPQPGDDAARVQQKAGLRAAALEEMKRSAGPGYASRLAPAAAQSGAASALPPGWSVKVN